MQRPNGEFIERWDEIALVRVVYNEVIYIIIMATRSAQMRVRNQSELRHFFFVRATIVGRDLLSMILENEERNKEGLGGGSE